MNEIKTHDNQGYRLAAPHRIKSTEEYLMLEKELASILNNGGPIHYWGGHDSGVWVQSEGEQQTYSPWMRSDEAITNLIVEHDVWACPYPLEHPNCYEGKYHYGGRFYSIYVPYRDHANKTLAYRFAILQTVIAKLRRIGASILPEERRQLPRHV